MLYAHCAAERLNSDDQNPNLASAAIHHNWSNHDLAGEGLHCRLCTALVLIFMELHCWEFRGHKCIVETLKDLEIEQTIRGYKELSPP